MLRLSHFIMIATQRTSKSANLQFEISDSQFKSLLLHCLPLAWKSMREGVCHPECCLRCWRQSSENKYINKSDTARHLLSKLFFDWLFECYCLSGLLRLVLKIDLMAIRFTLSSSMRAKSSYLSIHGEFATQLRKKNWSSFCVSDTILAFIDWVECLLWNT